MVPEEEAIEALAATQMGRFTRAQVAGTHCGHRSVVQSRLRSGKWRRLTGRVLCLPGAATGPVADLWTAALHLGPDAVVSHFSAARMHGVPVPPWSPASLILPRGANRRLDGFVVHQRGDLDATDVVQVGGLATTSIARTLVDLGREVSRSRLDAWLDELTAHRLVSPERVAQVVVRLSGQGRRPVPVLAAALADRLPGVGVEQGRLERALTDLTRRAGIPAGRAQYPHPGRPEGGELADRAWPDAKLIVEADGRTWHERMAAARADHRRDRTAAAQGWMTARFGHEELVRHPELHAADLAAIFAWRQAPVSAATAR